MCCSVGLNFDGQIEAGPFAVASASHTHMSQRPICYFSKNGCFSETLEWNLLYLQSRQKLAEAAAVSSAALSTGHRSAQTGSLVSGQSTLPGQSLRPASVSGQRSLQTSSPLMGQTIVPGQSLLCSLENAKEYAAKLPRAVKVIKVNNMYLFHIAETSTKNIGVLVVADTRGQKNHDPSNTVYASYLSTESSVCCAMTTVCRSRCLAGRAGGLLSRCGCEPRRPSIPH